MLDDVLKDKKKWPLWKRIVYLVALPLPIK